MYKVKGQVEVVNPTQVISDKFSKREIVLKISENNYDHFVVFQFTQDKCELLNSVSVGQEVEITFGLKGRAWTNPQGEVKYFNTLDAFRIEVESSAPVSTESDKSDDLPF